MQFVHHHHHQYIGGGDRREGMKNTKTDYLKSYIHTKP